MQALIAVSGGATYGIQTAGVNSETTNQVINVINFVVTGAGER